MGAEIGGVSRSGGLAAFLRGEAVLLGGAAQVVHGHPLHVGGDLDVVRIGNQIGETWKQDQCAKYSGS